MIRTLTADGYSLDKIYSLVAQFQPVCRNTYSPSVGRAHAGVPVLFFMTLPYYFLLYNQEDYCNSHQYIHTPLATTK